MPIKLYKPTSAGRRGYVSVATDDITTSAPHRPLLTDLRKRAGRNFRGIVTVRHQGGGHKQKYRMIDFKRDKAGVPAKVATIEYDPNRSARIALLHYADGEKRYILSPEGLKVGDAVESGQTCEPKVGNAMPLGSIPAGLEVHNVEMSAGQGGKMVRTAGGGLPVFASMSFDKGGAGFRTMMGVDVPTAVSKMLLLGVDAVDSLSLGGVDSQFQEVERLDPAQDVGLQEEHADILTNIERERAAVVQRQVAVGTLLAALMTFQDHARLVLTRTIRLPLHADLLIAARRTGRNSTRSPRPKAGCRSDRACLRGPARDCWSP